MDIVTMTRDEWEKRFAARIADAGFSQSQAAEIATSAANENLANNGEVWLDPEDDAEVEISYMAEDCINEA